MDEMTTLAKIGLSKSDPSNISFEWLVEKHRLPLPSSEIFSSAISVFMGVPDSRDLPPEDAKERLDIAEDFAKNSSVNAVNNLFYLYVTPDRAKDEALKEATTISRVRGYLDILTDRIRRILC